MNRGSGHGHQHHHHHHRHQHDYRQMSSKDVEQEGPLREPQVPEVTEALQPEKKAKTSRKALRRKLVSYIEDIMHSDDDNDGEDDDDDDEEDDDQDDNEPEDNACDETFSQYSLLEKGAQNSSISGDKNKKYSLREGEGSEVNQYILSANKIC